MESHMRSKSILLALLIAAAQATAAEGIIEEVIVTAQKHSQNVNDVPIAINAFTGERLADQGAITPENIAILTPGLTVNETASTGTPLYTIRGVGFQDYSTAASSTVGLYLDEVAIPYTVMSRGLLFDVNRVEVLKGPQGDLYGRNTTAGQINMVSNMPTDQFEAGVRGSVGSYDTVDLEAFVSGSLGDRVNGRLAFKTVQSGEGWQESLTRDDELGEQDVSAIRGILDFELSDSANLVLNLHYVDDQSENTARTAYDGRIVGLGQFSSPYQPLNEYIIPGSASFGQPVPWYSTGDNEDADWTNSYTSPITGLTWDLRPERDNQLFGASAKLVWDIGEVTLTSITAFDTFERVESNDWDGGFYNDSSNINTTDLDVFSQELRLSGSTDNLVWIAGLYYSKDEMDEYYHYFMSDSVFGLGSIPFGVGLFAPTPILELDTKYEQETESKAVFGHVEWQFTERWRLTAGLRYTEEERDWSGCTFVAQDGSLANFLNAQFGSTLGPGSCGTIDDDPTSPTFIFALIGGPNVNDAFHVYTDSISTEKWMGKLVLDFMINDDVMTYLSVSNGFKSGGFNGANSNTTQQLRPYEEEELTAIELGIKATLLEGRMQLNASVFDYDYENKQEQDRAVTFVGNISGLTNVPESTVQGAEIDVQWLVTDRLSVNASIAWLDTEVDKWLAVDTAASAWPTTVFRDASGIELAQAPELSYNLLVNYDIPLGNDWLLRLGADMNFKDDTSGGARVQTATEDYTIYNARVGLESVAGGWGVQLWSRNVTDEYYFPAAHTGGNGPFVRSVGLPRTYGLTFTYNTQ